MIRRLIDGVCSLLHDGGPSMTRAINLIVALTGAWLLFFWARSGGEMTWPWCTAFIAYLLYGAGPHVIKQALATLAIIKGTDETKKQEAE